MPSTVAATVTSLGGGLVTPAPEGACDPQVWTYTVDFASGDLLWDLCAVTGPGTLAIDYVPSSGIRALGSAELQAVEADLAAIDVSGRSSCDPATASLRLAIRSGDSAMLYGDDFHACTDKTYALYVESASLGAYARTLTSLAYR